MGCPLAPEWGACLERILQQGDWRTKSIAHVKRLNRSECELVLSVIAEKRTEKGWEMKRLLEKDQYDTFFDAIELQIYREIDKNYEY